jgi:hypothetical protein
MTVGGFSAWQNLLLGRFCAWQVCGGRARRRVEPAHRRKLSTGLKIPLDSGAALTTNRLELFGSAGVRCHI